MSVSAESLSALIADTDRRIVLQVLESEPASDLAVLFVSLPPDQGADLLNRLPAPLRAEIVDAITELQMMKQEAIDAIFQRIYQKIEGAARDTVLFDEGSKLLANLLAHMDVRQQEDILESLKQRKPEVSEKVRERLLSFGELVQLDDESIRLLVDNLELHTLAIALKSADANVRERFLANMSQEEAELLEAEIENLSLEHALASPQIQRVIVDTVRRFQAQGMIHFRSEESS